MVLDPDLDHVCLSCADFTPGLDNEDSPGFDMHYCGQAAGWLHRDCHNLIGCRDMLCDPTHI